MHPGANPETDRNAADSGVDAIVGTVLAEQYGINVADLAPVAVGQHTVNRRARTEDGSRDVFVKTYVGGPDGAADLAAERAAIELATLAGDHGVPVAPAVPNLRGELIDTSTRVPLSVWEWMPGSIVAAPDPRQSAHAGETLARIHVTFAHLPASVHSDPVAATRAWRAVDITKPLATIDQLQALIAQRSGSGRADAFDLQAAEDLAERRDMLNRLPVIAGQLPDRLHTQVLHGDYSPVNLLFNGDHVTAVLDFSPPRPGLISYDLGRIAVYPTMLTGRHDWPEVALALISAYRRTNPTAPDPDIRACIRIALIQLVRSLYGITQHYLAPGLYQHDLDEFWRARHSAARTLWRHLTSLDDALDDMVNHQSGTS